MYNWPNSFIHTKKQVPSGSKSRCSPRRHCCDNRPGLGVKCHYYSLLTGLSSIFKDSSLQVRSPHREYNTGSSTTVYLTILQDRLHTVSSSLYICVCTPQDLVVFSRISGSSRTLHIFSHVLLVIVHKPGKQVSTLKAYAIMRLSSFAYRITTQDWENLSALHYNIRFIQL